MREVTIHRCPVCRDIMDQAAELKSTLEIDPSVSVNIVDGRKGELTVNTDGRTIAGHDGGSLRKVNEMAAELRSVEPVPAG